ncbi:MAG: LamB/YcsF family protein [Propioniciclava sp.]
MAASIDLNADLGESFGAWRMGADEAMLGLVTSANLACGFHAGDPMTMRATTAAAAERGVVVGAHPSYRDLAGFGRRFLDVASDELAADVLAQLGALEAFCRVADTRISYVKPHGALYNATARHEGQAAAVIRAVRAFDPELAVLGLPGSALLHYAADAGLRPVAEAFADRAYAADGTLVPRAVSGAVLEDPVVVAERSVALAQHQRVTTLDGVQIPMVAESLCVHGDTPGAVVLARAVRTALDNAGVSVRPFLGSA